MSEGDHYLTAGGGANTKCMEFLFFRTARAGKVQRTQDGYAAYGDKFEVVAWNDISTGDATEILRGER